MRHRFVRREFFDNMDTMEELLNPSPPEPAAETDGTELAALTTERDRLAAEKEELWDRFLRKQA
ncbi:MAG: hypothetical protein HY238_16810, partial [Acidobacteria bacterium]|nr:hypothetical protein [Acidobacteriota bacterium]